MSFFSAIDKELSLQDFVEESTIQHYGLNADGQQAVTALMCMVHKLHPDVTYAPYIYSTAALWLHYMTAEQVRSSDVHGAQAAP